MPQTSIFERFTRAVQRRYHRADKYLRKNTRYHRVCEKLKSKDIMTQIQFLISIGPVFEAFLTSFQNQMPLIHMLHTESCALVRTLMLRFMKQEAVGVRRSKLATIDTKD